MPNIARARKRSVHRSRRHKGPLEWQQEEPNKMMVRRNGQPHRSTPAIRMRPMTRRSPRIRAEFPAAIRKDTWRHSQHLHRGLRRHDGPGFGKKVDGRKTLYPNVADGVDGMNFITQCVASSKEDGMGAAETSAVPG